tara:strand:+ start:6389 stop:7228 length:840 start_codon:yes stop_codon:yes gene_type:complete
VIGCGFIFDRHVAAIEHIGGKLLMACDIDEEKKMKLDSDVEFFTKVGDMVTLEKFNKEVDWVVICTPNYTHGELIKKVLKRGKNVLCEKPLVLSVKELEEIRELEARWGAKVYTVLQLRTSDKLKELRESLGDNNNVDINISMKRGDFYWDGWKGKETQSGGLLFNIGVHYFDLLLWLFGECLDFNVDYLSVKEGAGTLRLKKADIKWHINLKADKDNQYRVFEINGERLNLTRILENLHNKVYEQLLKGKGTTLKEVAPIIDLCEAMTNTYDIGGTLD